MLCGHLNNKIKVIKKKHSYVSFLFSHFYLKY